MAQFRKRPVVIEAVRVTAADYNGKTWDGSPFSEFPTWLSDAVTMNTVRPVTPGSTDYAEWEIRTLEGTMLASPGDWIICGVKGELYPIKDEIFRATYDAALSIEVVTPVIAPKDATEKMIAAGIDEFTAYDSDYETPREAVEQIYEAMIKAFAPDAK